MAAVRKLLSGFYNTCGNVGLNDVTQIQDHALFFACKQRDLSPLQSQYGKPQRAIVYRRKASDNFIGLSEIDATFSLVGLPPSSSSALLNKA